MGRQREANFEFCRILSMILVLLYHSAFNTFGFPASLDTCRPGIVMLAAFTVIGVNVFVLLTGYFSVRPKKQSILNIVFICVFYMAVKVLFELVAGKQFVPSNLFFISNSSWFIVIYFGLLIFAPLLNDFIESRGQKQLGLLILLLFIYETWFGFFPGIAHGYGFGNGYSVISFILLYLIGRYFCLYGLTNRVEYVLKLCYPLFALCFFAMFFVAIKSGYKADKMAGYICGYNNPVIIFEAVSFLLLFKNLKLGQRSGRTINYFAKSNLAVLFLHSSVDFFPYYSNLFRYLDSHFLGIEKILIWSLSILFVYIICVAIDQIRIICWKCLRSALFNPQSNVV